MSKLPNAIIMYWHCKQCVEAVNKGLAAGESPESYARLSIGATKQGVQVWCVRHNENVVHIDFEGHKHPLVRNDEPTKH